MMKIWRLKADVNRFAMFTAKQDFPIEEQQTFDGRKKSDVWIPYDIEKEDPDPIGNVASFHGFLIVDEKVKLILDKCAKGNVEFLPVYYGSKVFYFLNVIKNINCLEIEKSNCAFSSSDPECILIILKYYIDESAIQNDQIFKIEKGHFQDIFVTDEVVENIRNAGITGFQYELIWDGNMPEAKAISITGEIKVEY